MEGENSEVIVTVSRRRQSSREMSDGKHSEGASAAAMVPITFEEIKSGDLALYTIHTRKDRESANYTSEFWLSTIPIL